MSISYPGVLLIHVAFLFLYYSYVKDPAVSNAESNKTHAFYEKKDKFKGICYGPFRNNEGPNDIVYPSVGEIREDLIFLKDIAASIRVYDITGPLKEIPAICDSLNLDLYLGIHINSQECQNRIKIDSLVRIIHEKHPSIKGVIIGNEVIERNELSPLTLQTYIDFVRKSVKGSVPVGYADTWTNLLNNKTLVESCDFVMTHIYGYWDSIPADSAAQYVLRRWSELRASYPGTNVYLGETGWPSEGLAKGSAVPGPGNQGRFIEEFLRAADSTGGTYFYFDAFDEDWKTSEPNGVGPHWGLYTSLGAAKVDTLLLPPPGRKGYDRKPGRIESTAYTGCITIYDDCDSRYFYPTGWYGRYDLLELDEGCTTNPRSGRSCIRVQFHVDTTSANYWAGIIWQYPGNNWGNRPGYTVSTYSRDLKLGFSARGERGGEVIKFSACPQNSTSPCKDTYVGDAFYDTLTTDWKGYVMPLHSIQSWNNPDSLISSLGIAFTEVQNKRGCVIYLDDISLNFVYAVERVPGPIRRLDISPVPAREQMMIRYTLNRPAALTLSIYNLYGNEVKRVMDNNYSEQDKGYEVLCDVGALPAGVYYCVMRTNSFRMTKKFVVLK